MLRKHRMHILIAVLLIFIFAAVIKLANFKTVQNTEVNIKQPRIALIAHVKDNPYWQIVKKGAEKAAKERGCILEYYGSSTANADEDLNLINMNIAAKVNGIITYVQEEQKYSSIIDKGIEKGIPVITIDTDARQSKRIAYVGTDNVEAGKKAGEVLWEKASEDPKIGVIMAGFDTTNQVQRLNGFKNYLSTKPGVDIVSVESSNSNELNAKLAAEKIIREHPEVNFLYCVSAVDGIGAAKSVVENNLQNKITIICFDDLPETLAFIRSSIIYASIVQRPYDMGYESINMIMDKISGKALKSINITKSIVVTQSNVDSYNKNKKE
ncbi:substrate-binding domain-containing protein [Clostridium neuense]|uniref:Substrate-binding domain-containing protein n=1 Tax=Clostridium neuense TaxID=1728934 RepID=A0ABW8TID1_9CLOT